MSPTRLFRALNKGHKKDRQQEKDRQKYQFFDIVK